MELYVQTASLPMDTTGLSSAPTLAQPLRPPVRSEKDALALQTSSPK